MYGLLMDTTANSKRTDSCQVMAAHADEELAHAYEQITRAHEEIGRTEEQLSKLEHDGAKRVHAGLRMIRRMARGTRMPRKRHKPEEIVAKLRQVDVLVSQGQSVADAVRAIGVTEVTYYRWRQEYGGLKSDQVRKMRPTPRLLYRLRSQRPLLSFK
jgi:putative transposase